MAAATTSTDLPALIDSVDPQLKENFWRRFPKTRESYDRLKEQEVLKFVSGSVGWQRMGKPWFRRDAVTGVVFRRSPASRLHPTGRITVCVPYDLAIHVAVSISCPHKFIPMYSLMTENAIGSGAPLFTRTIVKERQAGQHRLGYRCEVHRCRSRPAKIYQKELWQL